ncbi:type II toxin-antitoxin system RelE/ParE family toxin [Wenzhouxiangella sp. EGI_FJ10409]|uniref:type II toxin-antitoxin system RelE/ParE family toxin n=1 Tax=Wenzhouxiangella sp. EGI_FJ10409 TaxID=3243767 RepID=UPI0035E24D5B
MSYRVRFTSEARADLERLYDFLLQEDVRAAEKALSIIERAFGFLEEFPFSCRRADDGDPFLRELLISFGQSGYVALFEVETHETVTVLAVRHQREEDYL